MSKARTSTRTKEETATIVAEIKRRGPAADPRPTDFSIPNENEVAAQMAQASIDVSRVICGVGQRLSEEIGKLRAAKEANDAEEARLVALHERDAILTDTANILDAHKSAMDASTAAWNLELSKQKQQLQDQQIMREREAAHYAYERDQARKKEADSHAQACLERDRKCADKQRELESSWAARERLLQESEDGFTTRNKELAAWPAKHEAEVKAEVGKAKGDDGARVRARLGSSGRAVEQQGSAS